MRNLLGVLVSTAALGATAVAARGHHDRGLHTRATTDTCANLVNRPLVVTLGGIESVTIGLINVCLCLSDIPNFESTNIVAQAAIAVAGVPATTTSLTTLVEASGHTCSYPDGSVPACSSSNPCSFTCTNGFTALPAANPTSCECVAPNTVCNGVCGTASCPSSVPVAPVRRGYPAAARRRSLCPTGQTICGLHENRGRVSQPWECVDTKRDLESCGGCITPLDAHSPRGVDCTAIAGVSDVSCRSGSCYVRRCAAGYAVSSDRTSCISEQAMLEQY